MRSDKSSHQSRQKHQHHLSSEVARKLRSRHHSGFQVWVGGPIPPEDRRALERLSAYILRPSFASRRLDYDKTTGQIEYETTKGIHRSMDALDWIALVTSHIPNPHEQTLRYYGRYSNASRGKRRKQALGISVTRQVAPPVTTPRLNALPKNAAVTGLG